MTINNDIVGLFILAIPVACIAWTVTHEEIFAEIHNYCVKCSKEGKSILKRKFFYLFTCEYCFSHYISALMLIITKFHLLYDDWRGYLIAGFSLVWIANIYMSIYATVRVTLKKERIEADIFQDEKELIEEKKNNHI
jgi:hypothetical protein